LDLELVEIPGWAPAEAALQSAPMLGPAPGFARRWRLRLAERRARRARRQVWGALGLALGGALAALALWAALIALSSPADLAVEFALRVAALERGLGLMLDLAEVLLGNLPLLLRALGALGLSVTVGWLCALWLASLYRLSYREVRNGG
jgi:hypothetical protein